MKILILFAPIFFAVHIHSPQSHSNTKFHWNSDSSELREFKSFCKQFFSAVKKSDTNFLKEHITFPIETGQFDNFDQSLTGKKYIQSGTFFKKLNKLFPADLLKELNKAEYAVSRHPGRTTNYIVTINSDEGGVESNANWLFVRKKNQFYFEIFTAEAG
jgi:hypothetical protein